MKYNEKHLIVLGCSATKLETPGLLPAIARYNGPIYKTLKAYLRNFIWPNSLSIAILSAKYGLIGGLAPIEYYNKRMNKHNVADISDIATETLSKWGKLHDTITLVLGKDYLPAFNFERLNQLNIELNIIEGPIGIKLNHFHTLLRNIGNISQNKSSIKKNGHPLYFLPDWDDMLDVKYNFEKDLFSSQHKKDRKEEHCIKLMKPKNVCDGVLVSLAQNFGSKGALRKFDATDCQSLAPTSLRDRFGLSSSQWLFGDCGAFSYINEPYPTISIEQAISLYQIHGFDLGASVDHIPIEDIIYNNKKIKLSLKDRQKRIEITNTNAHLFMQKHKEWKCSFNPVGIIQGITPDDYSHQLEEYLDMGYEHIAIGGLVFKNDKEIVEIVTSLAKAKTKIGKDVWIHLFGVFRPKIQPLLHKLGISSFDSATYFRKAWLRSDQNYLCVDKKWYAAIRVPMTSDPRTLKRLNLSGVPFEKLQKLEQRALNALYKYEKNRISLEATIEHISDYDNLLIRNEKKNYLMAYKRTLEDRPWEKCNCPVCSDIGINVIIFRGYNRNKRRGAHNTLMLYNMLQEFGRI